MHIPVVWDRYPLPSHSGISPTVQHVPDAHCCCVFSATRRYVVDEIFRGRWYDKAHKSEVVHPPNFELLKTKHRCLSSASSPFVLRRRRHIFAGWRRAACVRDLARRNRLLCSPQQAHSNGCAQRPACGVGAWRAVAASSVRPGCLARCRRLCSSTH